MFSREQLRTHQNAGPSLHRPCDCQNRLSLDLLHQNVRFNKIPRKSYTLRKKSRTGQRSALFQWLKNVIAEMSARECP